MRHLDLFSGIGGFRIAAEEVWGPEYQCLSFCEIDKKSVETLYCNWPETPCHNDVQTITGKNYGAVNLLTAGWPCQGNSKAKQVGARKGLEDCRSGLFYSVRDAVSHFRPDNALFENVPELLTINNGEDFREVLRCMAEIGYNVEWDCLHANTFGAPHKRERLFMAAYPSRLGFQAIFSRVRDVLKKGIEKERRVIAGATCEVGGYWKTEPPVLCLDDGISCKSHGIKGPGNAIVPQVVVPIMQAIKEVGYVVS